MHRVARAHVTVVYPEETVDAGLLLERLESAAGEMAPFGLRVGRLTCDDEGHGGVFALVDDPAGSLESLRDRLLLPPQRFAGYPFHVTIAHPRTAAAPARCWEEVRGHEFDVSFPVNEVLWTATDESARTVLSRFRFAERAASTRVAMAAGVLIDGARVLLALRHPERTYYPGTWDLPGGHVEPGESARRALHRELREELGIDAVLGAPWRYIADDALGIGLSIWVVRQWRGAVANLAEDEHERLGWFTLSQLESLALAHPTYTSLLHQALEHMNDTGMPQLEPRGMDSGGR